jgi:simple sugar transport system ATP-binding protein
MVGSELPTPETRVDRDRHGRALRRRGPSEGRADGGCSQDVRFEIHRGEIVGIAGVEGNGQSELVEA